MSVAHPRVSARTLAAVLLASIAAVAAGGISDDARVAAELDRQRLTGAAHYENDDFKAAAVAFERCTELSPESYQDHFNLALSKMRAGAYEEALGVLERVEQLDPAFLGTYYVRGIVLKNLGRLAEAVRSLGRVTGPDPECFGAFYNLGVCYKKMEQLAEARAAFEAAVRVEPEHPSAHYQMITLTRKMGDVDGSRRHAEIFDRLKDTVDESEKTVEALERSRYSNLVRTLPFGDDLPPATDAAVRFVDMTAKAGLVTDSRGETLPVPELIRREEYDEDDVRGRWVSWVGGAVALGDTDRDGDLDVYIVGSGNGPGGSTGRLYVNQDDGRFIDLTDAYGLGTAGRGTDAIFGDYDNDGHDDLYVVNDGPNVLYRKQGDGAFEGSAGEAGDARAILDLTGPLPDAFTVEVGLRLGESDDRDPDGFLLLDYRGPGDFVFAGARTEEGYWTLGHYDGSWVEDARLEDAIATGKSYPVRLRIDGGNVTLLPEGPEADKAVSHDFGRPLARGRIGLAVARGVVRFDDLTIVAGGGRDELHAESFADGRADGFTTDVGDWRVVDWMFEDVSVRARVNEPQLGRGALFVDYDHDNDLDLYVINGVAPDEPPDAAEFAFPRGFPGQVNTLLRNNGNGTFSDRTDEAGLLVDISQSRGVLFGDFESDGDTDLFVANTDAESLLFTNLRLGRFGPGGTFAPPIGVDTRAAASGDFNRDGHMDLLVANGKSVRLYLNGGKADFVGQELPLPDRLAAGGVGAVDVLDYNNDGWSDLLLREGEGQSVHLLAGTGSASFLDVSSRVGLNDVPGGVTDAAIGDLDGDGDEDIVLQTRESGPRLLMNRGGNERHWLAVRTNGKKVNRNGYGAFVEVAARGHYQKKAVTDGVVHFGIGDLERVDVVRVTWPNGVAQNVVGARPNAVLDVDEKVRVSASCGFLWTDNGRELELINEILGVGALGAPIAPGRYHQPDSTELTKIEAEQLVPRNGSYELRLTEELREIMYADRIALRVVDHPAELEIVPNEMFTAPPFPEDRFFAVADARPPRTAVDDRGQDVLESVLGRDGSFPTFDRVPGYDGLAEPHSLTLDLGDVHGAERITLFLDGWIYWPEASTVMALAQDPRYEIRPLAVQVRDGRGGWRTVIESAGLPTSKGLVVPVDLTGVLPPGDSVVRLATNLCIYFDRVFVSTRDEAARCRSTELPVARADLDYRGFSKLRRDTLGFERFDYADVSPTGPWSPPTGSFTRYGEVTELLESEDDMYVVLGPGDELKLSFDAGLLAPLAEGWVRDFIFYAGGWVKDGDLNTAFSNTVEPLPFRGMSGYPYSETERYPDGPETRRYRATYNTRPGVPTVGTLSCGTGDPAFLRQD